MDRPFLREVSSQALNLKLPLTFDEGWSPVPAAELDGFEVVFKTVDHIRKSEDVNPSSKPLGFSTDSPSSPIYDKYWGLSGYTTIDQAVRIPLTYGLNIDESVTTHNPLYEPAENPWVTYAEDDNHMYLWNGTAWFDLGEASPDISNKVDKVNPSIIGNLVAFLDAQGAQQDSGVRVNTTLNNVDTEVPTSKAVLTYLNTVYSHTQLQNIGIKTHDEIDAHIDDVTSNPHNVDLEQVLTQDNDGAGIQIKNIGTPTDNQDAVTLKYFNDNTGAVEGDYIRTKLTGLDGTYQSISTTASGSNTTQDVISNILEIYVEKEDSSVLLEVPEPDATFLDTYVTILNTSAYGTVGTKTKGVAPAEDNININELGIGTTILKCTLTNISEYKWEVVLGGEVNYNASHVVSKLISTTDSTGGEAGGFASAHYTITAGSNTSGTSTRTFVIPPKIDIGNIKIFNIADITSARPVKIVINDDGGSPVYTITENTGDCIYILRAIRNEATGESDVIYDRFSKGILIDEDNMASDRDDIAPTQQSVKAYVDSKAEVWENLPMATNWAAVNDGLVYTITSEVVKIVGSAKYNGTGLSTELPVGTVPGIFCVGKYLAVDEYTNAVVVVEVVDGVLSLINVGDLVNGDNYTFNITTLIS